MLKETNFHGDIDFQGFMQNNENKNNNNKKFSEYCSIFTFATENLDSYLRELNVKNTKVLTVTSSGDQLINLALLGANNIDCFDINRLCYYYTKLKLTGLMFLDYEDFMAYFAYCDDSIFISNTLYALDINDQFFNYNIYNRISEKLEPGVKIFFDALYAEYHYDGIRIARSPLFNNVSLASAMYNNTYLVSPENYYQARENIEKLIANKRINFYNLDIFELHTLEQKYDIVLLSNIYDYIPVSLQDDFTNYIKHSLNNILTPSAKVAVEYQYCGDSKQDNDHMIHNLSVNKDLIVGNEYALSKDIETLSTLRLGVIKVPTIYKELREGNIQDCIYVYHK